MWTCTFPKLEQSDGVRDEAAGSHPRKGQEYSRKRSVNVPTSLNVQGEGLRN